MPIVIRQAPIKPPTPNIMPPPNIMPNMPPPNMPNMPPPNMPNMPTPNIMPNMPIAYYAYYAH